MCSPAWPITISKQAFTDYAKERGWSDEQIAKAWLWCTTRQNKMNIDTLAEAARKRKEAEKQPDPPCICQCPRCKMASS